MGKIFTLYRTIPKIEKAHKPSIKNTKNVSSTTPSATRIIYLVHYHLYLAIISYTQSFRFGRLDLDSQI